MHPYDTTNEEWRDVIGYEGTYQVSNLGKVRSIPRQTVHINRWGTKTTRNEPGKVLRPALNGSGYLFVNLFKQSQERNRGYTPRMVHTLVAEAFHGPRPEGHDIHHKDHDRYNNYADNLEYKLAFAHTSNHSLGNMPGNAKLKMAEIEKIRTMLQQGKMSQAAIARQYGVSPGLITMIKQGKRWNR